MQRNKRWTLWIGIPLIAGSLLLASCRQASPPPTPNVAETGQRTIQHGQNTQDYARYLMALGQQQGRASVEIEGARWLEMGQEIVKDGEQLTTFAPLLNIPSRGTQPQEAGKLELDDLWADGMLLKAYGNTLISKHRNMKVELLKKLTQKEITEEQVQVLIRDCNLLEEAGQLMMASGQHMQDYVTDFQRSIGAPTYGSGR